MTAWCDVRLATQQLGGVLGPLAANAVLVASLAQVLGLDPGGSAPFAALLPLRIGGATEAPIAAATNAAVIVALAAACTYLFAALYGLRCRMLVHWLVFAAFGAPLAWLSIEMLARIRCDWIVAVLVAWNAGVGVAWAVVYRAEHANPSLATAALVVAITALAWPFLCLDELTLWTTLAGLAVWDVFAVTSSLGAFRLILNERQRRIWMAEDYELPAGLLFETDSGFSLGSGDFLLYAVLVGRSSMRGTSNAAAATLGLVAGHSITVFWSVAKPDGDSVPALPAALLLGMLLYFAVASFIAPALRASLPLDVVYA
ncbi:hypothetical protein CTAYLR_001230 [Chrysophaeum taylorii]|uniref:Presenilin n=1 Tax=Chrysophaeum taylorii TaxID=2483200 RepID=A0AAD7UEY0_9STRA|nr:hypothetical protein CTAYLR_001230 [Chrysophaeum taylorii]